MNFTKMQGCGNDYIYINGFLEQIDMQTKPSLVRRLSDRHFGIGSDGVIFINPSDEADFEMEMYNADGSRGEMCGNGIRCVAKYVYDKAMTDRTNISVISCGQIKYLDLDLKEGKVDTVKVNMGQPILASGEIPVYLEKTGKGMLKEVIAEEITIQGKIYTMTCVSMGNPHAVVFIEDTDCLDIEKIGPDFEHHAIFPNRVNTEFVQVIDRHTIKMRVWERGSGETLACGTGACACVAASVLNGLTEEEVIVKLVGGELAIRYDRKENLIYMTGAATTVFDGQISL